MNPIWRTALWQQYGAAIDMLETHIACPDDVDRPPHNHVLVRGVPYAFFDLYLRTWRKASRRLRLHLNEMDPAGRSGAVHEPSSGYLATAEQCRAKIEQSPTSRRREVSFPWLDISAADLLLYDMRHVQHHTGQLNLILRQRTDSAPLWVRFARSEEPSPTPSARSESIAAPGTPTRAVSPAAS